VPAHVEADAELLAAAGISPLDAAQVAEAELAADSAEDAPVSVEGAGSEAHST
jgi:hypothetical protein